MNELQQKEFELLKTFVKVCEKLNINYFLVCGTALGAAKYQGFIPWDDDIDVGLLRDDYQVFLQQAPKLLPDWAFLQNHTTDPNFPHLYSKLRNSQTTYIEKGVEHLSMNHGVYIDIFPIDGYPQDKSKQKIFELRKKLLSWKYLCALDSKNEPLKVVIRDKFFRLLGYHKRTAKTLDKMDKLLSSNSVHTSALWCNFGNWQGKLEYAPRQQYGNGTKAMFEGIQVIIPQNYDSYLTQKYGDWHNDPPKEEQIGHHFYSICDLNKSYKEYI